MLKTTLWLCASRFELKNSSSASSTCPALKSAAPRRKRWSASSALESAPTRDGPAPTAATTTTARATVRRRIEPGQGTRTAGRLASYLAAFLDVEPAGRLLGAGRLARRLP